jgi:hypothetical protein
MGFANILVVDNSAHFPSFCAFTFREDDPSAVAWIDFWAVEPCSNAEADYARGQKYAEEAIWHVRTTRQPAFVECVLMGNFGLPGLLHGRRVEDLAFSEGRG